MKTKIGELQYSKRFFTDVQLNLLSVVTCLHLTLIDITKKNKFGDTVQFIGHLKGKSIK